MNFSFPENIIAAIIEGLMAGGTKCLPVIDAVRAECHKQSQQAQQLNEAPAANDLIKDDAQSE